MLYTAVILSVLLLVVIEVIKDAQYMYSFICTFVNSFIPSACAECDDSLPFSGASSICLCYVIFPATILHHLFFHPLSPHLSNCFLVYLSILFPNSYTGCPRRNGQNFRRVFLMLNYTDIIQNTYIQS